MKVFPPHRQGAYPEDTGMTQAIASPAVHDLIGIGFGPSNLALAIALQEREKAQGKLDVLFLDKQADYRWHGNTLVTQSELQISFLKDLVTLRNPTSPYSFVNYLKTHDRLVDFINLGTFYPCRMEYNDYLRWVAGSSMPRPTTVKKCWPSSRSCISSRSRPCA